MLVTVSRSKVPTLVRGFIRLGVGVIVLVSCLVRISFVVIVCCVRASAPVRVFKRSKVLVKLRVGVIVLVSNLVRVALLTILVTPVARPLVIVLSRLLASVPVGDLRGYGGRVGLGVGVLGIVSC